jgi:hypothetical protein
MSNGSKKLKQEPRMSEALSKPYDPCGAKEEWIIINNNVWRSEQVVAILTVAALIIPLKYSFLYRAPPDRGTCTRNVLATCFLQRDQRSQSWYAVPLLDVKSFRTSKQQPENMGERRRWISSAALSPGTELITSPACGALPSLSLYTFRAWWLGASEVWRNEWIWSLLT